MTKKMVNRESKSFIIGLSNKSTLQGLREFLNTVGAPPNAQLQVSTDYGGDPDKLWFEYQSLETDEEYERRLKKEYYEQKRIQDDEIAMYKILKKKFEGENE